MNNWYKFFKGILEEFRESTYSMEKIYGIKGFSSKMTYLGKKSDRIPNQKTILDLEKALKIKIIKDADGNLSYQKLTDDDHGLTNPGDSSQKIIYNSFPVVSIVRAGLPNGVREGEILYYAEFNYTKRDGVIAVLVEGDSMEPELKHGDIVLVDKFVELTPGCIVVAVFTNSEHTIKK